MLASLLVLALVAGSLVYCLLTIVAAFRYRAVRPHALKYAAPISILKPLAGVVEGLEENLRSFFEQDYPEFEILMAVRSAEEPALAVAERLIERYPKVRSRLLVTGEPPYPNHKVYSLNLMLAQARHELIVMSDGDTRVGGDLLQRLAAEFQEERVGLATCPYRAVASASFWSKLEAVGLNTSFLGGVLVARMLDGMKFALGPTIAARRAVLERIGGFDRLKDYLAEDFVMGKLAAAEGYGVILSSYVIEHRIGSQALGANLRHRLRWNRSTRRSRPWGYVGQVFTNPLPLALLLWGIRPEWWGVVLVTAGLRAASAWAVASRVLDDPLIRRRWWLLPLEDLLSMAMWLGAFFGNTILWRGREYYLKPDGRFEQIGDRGLGVGS